MSKKILSKIVKIKSTTKTHFIEDVLLENKHQQSDVPCS